MDQRLTQTRRATTRAALLLLALVCGKAAAGYYLQADILLADALHSGTDLLALGAVWFGITLAARERTNRFPYGFYRAETLAALTAALVILALGIDIAIDGIQQWHESPVIRQPMLAMIVAGASAVVSFIISKWERRTGQAGNSQSLHAVADESLMDVYSSGLVLLAIGIAQTGISWVLPMATLFISAVVMYAGVKHAIQAILSLMDASVDPLLEKAVTSTLAAIPEIRSVHKIRCRRCGPFYFIEGHVEVSGSLEVTRSHSLSHMAEDRVRQQHPNVEGVILHVEPYCGVSQRVLLPVQNDSGMQAAVEIHFGRAPWFLLVVSDSDGIRVERILPNTFQSKGVQAGLAVINRLIREYAIDVVIAREMGEIAYYALHEHGVQIYEAVTGTAEESLAVLATAQLRLLSAPTHSSESGEWKDLAKEAK